MIDAVEKSRRHPADKQQSNDRLNRTWFPALILTETVRSLANLSQFLIVDITNPRSTPLELQVAAPDYMCRSSFGGRAGSLRDVS
jgi:hypothetical protein